MSTYRLSTLVVICVVSLGASMSLAADEGLVLASFESPMALQPWRARGTTISLSTRWALRGKASLKVEVPAWKQGLPKWPNFELRFQDGTGYRLRDWSSQRYLTFDAFNAGDEVARFSLILTSDPVGVKGQHQQNFELKPREWRPLTVDLQQLASPTRVDSVEGVHFFLTRPSSAVTLLIDHLRLATALPSDDPADLPSGVRSRLVAALRLPDALEGLAGSLKTLQRRIGSLSSRHSEVRRQARKDLAADRSRCRDLKRRIRSLRDDVSEARRLGDEIVSVRGEIEDRCRLLARLAGARGGGVRLAVVSSLEKVPLDRAYKAAGVLGTPARIGMARGEHEAVQLVVTPMERPLSGVGVKPAAELPDGVSVSVAPVGFVKTAAPPYDHEWSGWWPDPILDYLETVDVALGENQPFWIRFHAGAEAPAGTHRLSLVVSDADGWERQVAVDLTVWDFEIPVKPSLPDALSIGRNDLWRMYPDRNPDESLAQLERFLMRYRMGPDAIYRGDLPRFDLIERRQSLGWLQPFNLKYLLHEWLEGKSESQRRAFIESEFLGPLRGYVPRLEERGLLEQAYVYGFDERKEEGFDRIVEAFGAIKREFPKLRTMTTSIHPRYGRDHPLDDVVDIWVPLLSKYDPDEAARARARGKQVWWYICVGPQHPYPNWFIEYPAIEIRLIMGLMAHRYRPDGFLYYSLNLWKANDHPITSRGPRTAWNPASYKAFNGDGSVFCPGPDGPIPTIRLECYRDGSEDLEFLLELDRRVAAAREAGARRRDLVPALQAAELGRRVLSSLTEFSRDPRLFSSWRTRVAEAIEALSPVVDHGVLSPRPVGPGSDG